MVMIGDLVLFVEGVATFLRCSRRGYPTGATHGLMSTADSCAKFIGDNAAKARDHEELSGVSTDGSNTDGSTDTSDTESTADSADSNSKQDVLEVQPPVMPPPGLEGIRLGNKSGESAKQSCLNKSAQAFVPRAPVACLDCASSVTNANCSPQTEVQTRIADVISKLSPADAATVSAFLKLKLAKEEQAVQPAVSNLPAPLGFRRPPGLCQESPKQIEHSLQPLPPGLVMPQAKIVPPKSQDGSEVEENDLRRNLNKLTQFDPACIFLVRKINRLGLNSADFLKAYFAKFGVVECVLASHSMEKSSPGRRKPRVRPAGLAFVVMDKPEDVAKILRFGSHVVRDVNILASPYEQHEPSNAGTEP